MKQPIVYIIFIGGAADKEPFVWGGERLPFQNILVHNTMERVAECFCSQLKRHSAIKRYGCQLIDDFCKLDYLSYSEICFDSLKDFSPEEGSLTKPQDANFDKLLENIGAETKVYIVGHSLGGWNGAHLSYILSKFAVNVEYLVTLDPVGTGNHELALINPLIRLAKIYKHEPKPIAKKWINIQAHHIDVSAKQINGTFEDWIAWAGGQWEIDKCFPDVDEQICEVTNFSHSKAQLLFTYPTVKGYSASDDMVESVVNALVKYYKQQSSLLAHVKRWFTKLV